MKTNITLKIEAELLREARVLAAEESTSAKSSRAFRAGEIHSSICQSV
jgi:hypothetical protein